MNGAAQFTYPFGVAVDATGNLYVTDAGHIRKIVAVGANWVVSTIAADGLLGPFANAGIALDSASNVYIADDSHNSIVRVTSNGLVTTLSDQFRGPRGIALDGFGNVYVVDLLNCIIGEITPVGTNWAMSTIAGLAGSYGGNDGTGTNARFGLPEGIAVDGADNLYVADSANYTIRKITPVGSNWVVSTLAGHAQQNGDADGAGPNAQFFGPLGVAVDGAGNVYVADTQNSIIRVVTPAGEVSTLAGGSAQSAGSANGSGSAARFSGPRGLATDQFGNVFVADAGNNTIRRVTPAGNVSTDRRAGRDRRRCRWGGQ